MDDGKPTKPEPVAVPVPLLRDLFGQRTVAPAKAARSDSQARRSLRNFRAKMQQEGIGPLDVVYAIMLERFKRGDEGGALDCAKELLPYSAPKLNALAVVGEGSASGAHPGALVIRWEDGQIIDAGDPGEPRP